MTDSVNVVDPFLRFEIRFIADQFERRRDDFFLPLRQRFSRVILLTAAATATAALLALTILAAKRPDFDEINVRGDGIRRLARVERLSVIGNEVAGLKVVFFKEKRVAGGYFLRALALVIEEFNLLFRPAIYGEVQFKLIDAEVILGVQSSTFVALVSRPGFVNSTMGF